ncbi:MAG: hypothetical protein JWN08_3386 [Frankiales bacterium]|nr:hypothetical protein [Frankiales bacterium]
MRTPEDSSEEADGAGRPPAWSSGPEHRAPVPVRVHGSSCAARHGLREFVARTARGRQREPSDPLERLLVTLLDAVRPGRRPSPDVGAAPAAVPMLTGRQLAVLLLVGAVLLAATSFLVLGPGRGVRNDVTSLRTDLSASRGGIFATLGTGREALAGARLQLRLTEQSLAVQEQGLEVAVEGERDAQTAARASEAILVQTREALALVREVTAALGPLDRLEEQVDSVVAGVEQGVRLAQSALRVAEQTLATGQQALTVARDTLASLRRSEQVQRELLATARATLEQTRQINRKIPGVPIFPTAPAGATAP